MLIDQIKQLLSSINAIQLASLGIWSYFLLAFLVAIEGPIATLLGGAAASLGLMYPGLVFLAAATGNLIADTLWYALGYLGKIEWINRFGQRLGISPEKLENSEKMLRDHAPTVIFISKLTVSPMIPALIATGLIKYPWKRWFPADFAGEMIWTGSLVVIGYYGVRVLQKVTLGIEHAILIGSVIFVVLIFWFGRKLLTKQAQSPANIPDEPPDEKEG